MNAKRLPLGQSSTPPDYEIEVSRPAIPAPGQPGTLREQLASIENAKPSKPQPCREELQAKGRRRKERGMAAALAGKCIQVARGQLAFIEALLRSPDGTASIDDATSAEELAKRFDDNGKWRGSIPKSLGSKGIITKDGYVTSCRPSRHACDVKRWKLKDRAKAEAMAKELREAFAALFASNEPQQRRLELGGIDE